MSDHEEYGSSECSDSDSWSSFSLDSELFDTPLEKLGRLCEEREMLKTQISTFGETAASASQLEMVTTQLKECQEEVKESEQVFEKAMKAGSVSVNITNALVLGEAGVGKTSTKCILFDKDPPQVRTSTPLAEAPIQIRLDHHSRETGHSHTGQRDVNVVGVQVQSAANSWKPLNDEQLEQIVTDVIAVLVHKQEKNPIQTDDAGLVSDVELPAQAAPQIEVAYAGGNSSKDDNDQLMFITAQSNIDEVDNDLIIVPKIPETIPASLFSVLQCAYTTIYERMAELVASKTFFASNIGSPNEVLGSNWIYLIDSGGQPHFHNLLPHFVHGISVALFVHRLSRKLEEYPMVEYYEEGQAIGEPYQSSFTTEDTLKCLIRSMQSNTISGEKPKLLFVGTFLDQIEQSSETLEEKNKKLLKLLTPEFTNQLMFCKTDLESLIFPLNAKHPNDHEKEIAILIRSAVESSSRKVNVPIWWYILQITLRNLGMHLKRMVLSLQECLLVALRLNISKSALIEALKFFHHQHMFHYYSDILPGVVFISPQVLLDKLTELVREAFKLRKKNPSCYANKGGNWRGFRDRGIILIDFLKQFPMHYCENVFSPRDLLKIFSSQLILTPLVNDISNEDIDYTSSSVEYYMPSLLDMLPPTERDSCVCLPSKVHPLLIRFFNGWPRAGVFCCLQVHLIQKLSYRLVLDQGKPKLIAQNCVMLSPPNSSCIVTLIDSFSYFEIHIDAELDICRRVCPKIQNDILNGIEVSCKTLRYKDDSPHLAFLCPCTSTSSTCYPQHHAAELFKEEGSLRCTINEMIRFKVDCKHSIWLAPLSSRKRKATSSFAVEDLLQKSGLSEDDINKECTDKHILEIYRNLENWELVSMHLGLKTADITAIREATHEPRLKRLHALRKWKSIASMKGDDTFEILLTALLECEYTEHALEVCELLK